MGKDLDIHVTPLVEDVFYIVLAIDEKISAEAGRNIFNRIHGKFSEEEYRDALDKAKKMLENLNEYGFPCNEWKPENVPMP